METVPITVACHPYDRVRGLFDGTVRIEGCEAITLPLCAEEAFHRAYGHGAFEVSELSMSSYILTTVRGTCPYVAVPVFLSRVFRHSALYVRTDRGINKPSDLRGKLVGVPEYQMTASLWVRGMLSDVYGVAAHEIRWRTGGLELPGRIEKFGLKLPLPFDVAAIPQDRSLNQMLVDGDLDALVSARAPSSFGQPNSSVARLFPDYRAAEQEYFRNTGVFPIMHVVGIRKDIAKRYPWLPASVYKAFELAKSNCMASMKNVAVLDVTLPWLNSYIEETTSLMGEDYWPYGLESNRKPLEAMIRYSVEQGLSPHLIKVEDLFAEGTHDRFKV